LLKYEADEKMKDDPNAPYITEFFKFLKDTYDDRDDPEAYVREVTENFESKLNKRLAKSLDNFFLDA